MNDNDILLRLLQQAYTDETLIQPAKKEYETLVVRFDEYGAEQEIPLDDLDEHRESSLRNLKTQGYTTQSLRYHGPEGGHVLHVNLRGEKYLELANDKRSVVVEPEPAIPNPFTNPQNNSMQDSGQRQTFSTGAVRDSAEGNVLVGRSVKPKIVSGSRPKSVSLYS